MEKKVKKTEIILKEGYPYIFISGVLFLISLFFKFALFWQLPFFVVFLFFLCFFRNPERIPEDTSKGAIISPSDGEIIEIIESNVQLVATNESEVDDETAEKVEKLIDALEADDDVQNVIHNMA